MLDRVQVIHLASIKPICVKICQSSMMC